MSSTVIALAAVNTALHDTTPGNYAAADIPIFSTTDVLIPIWAIPLLDGTQGQAVDLKDDKWMILRYGWYPKSVAGADVAVDQTLTTAADPTTTPTYLSARKDGTTDSRGAWAHVTVPAATMATTQKSRPWFYRCYNIVTGEIHEFHEMDITTLAQAQAYIAAHFAAM